MNAPLAPRQLLQHMEVPSRPGVFILGSLERRVTLYSQQVRALNLIHALFTTERLKEGQRVAVLGGGAAGLTASAGAALRGCSVTLLEQMHTLLPIFQRSRKRLLHPHLYDWPEEGWANEHAGLPVLDWSADVASEVASQLLRGWEEIRRSHSIDLHLDAKDIEVRSSTDSSHSLAWYTQQLHDDRFDVVILAVGFGLERSTQGVPSLSYWDDDNLDQPQRDPAHPLQRVLVSGTGDGGLVDLLRVRLEGFQQETMVRDLLSNVSLERTCQELLDIEQRVRNCPQPDAALTEHYKQLRVPPALDEQLQQRLRKDTRAVLNGREPFPLSPSTSILNRFLVSRLLWGKDGARFVSGPLKVQTEGTGYTVTFQSGRREHFDRLIIRHGTEPALSTEKGFSWLSDEDIKTLRARCELDQTREPIWDDDRDFSRKRAQAASTPTRTHAPPPPRTDPLVGRKAEVGLLVEEILGPSPAPVVVLGPPGIGKSTIALAALGDAGVKKHYGKRRYFARLDGADTVEAIPARVAHEMGVRSVSDLSAQVLTRLDEAPTLLILDNADTPWQQDRLATEDLLQALARRSQLALITTVRGKERPDFGGIPSRVVKVPPLTLEESRKLFCSIAYNVDQNDPDLLALLQEMEGVALAVKLLAKQAEGVDLEITLQRWREERMAMLQTGCDQDSNLAVSIEVSLKSPRLSKEALRFLSVLALLPAGLTEKHRGAIFPWSAAALALLQKAALIEREGQRWRLLVVIREQVRTTRPPQEEDKKKLLEFYFSLAQRLGPQVGKANGREAFNQLFEEIDNIERLLLMALEVKDTEVAIAAALQVSDFVRFSGRSSAQPLEKAREVARSQGDRVKEAWCLLALSRLHLLRRPQYNRARQLLEEALGLFQQAGDPKGEAECLRELGHTAANEYELEKVEGKLEQAEGYFRRALTMQEQFDDPIGEAYCLHGLARVALLQDKHEEARRLFRKTLQMFREQKDQLGQAYSLRHLGELEEDDSQLRKACELFKKVGELRNLAHGLRSRSDLARKRGEFEEAESLCRQALGWFLKLQAPREAAWCRISLAQVVHALSRPPEAYELLEQALESALQPQSRDEQCEEKCLRLLGEWEAPPA